MTDENYYSEYLTLRKPNSVGERMLRKWHASLLQCAVNDLAISEGARILEIGAGHGIFAVVARDAGLSYDFVDISKSVCDFMSTLGFSGHCGELAAAPSSFSDYDLIWMSHVLEHSTSWSTARALVDEASKRLRQGGNVVVVSPDLLSSTFEFWSSDWSHGYPTSRRNVVQLFSDVGLEITTSRYHRGGSFSLFGRGIWALVALVPHSLIDLLLTPARHRRGEGYFYSWKTAFGWRQIFISGRRN